MAGIFNVITKFFGNKYDKDMVDWKYSGPQDTIDLFKKHNSKKDIKILDAGCGTGLVGIELKKNGFTNFDGADFSQKMLNIAKSKSSNNSGVQYLLGNAMEIPFSDTNFDAVTIGYGLRNVPNLNGCLQEILRVLKPGGILVSLDVGKVRLPVIKELNNFYFFRIVPLIGNLLIPGQDMFQYLPNSSLEYPNQESLKRLMFEAGFQQVEIHDFVFGASTVHVACKPTIN